MPLMGRLALFIYNLLFLAVAGVVVAISLGWTEPIAYLNWVVSTPENRIIMGALGGLGVLLVVLVLIMSSRGTKGQIHTDEVLVEQGFPGEVSISIAAIKVIIMKAVKHVEGVRETRPMIRQSPEGVVVTLHTMINPDLSVPQLAGSLQAVVKDSLEKIAGLQVAEIKILVDEFNPANK